MQMNMQLKMQMCMQINMQMRQKIKEYALLDAGTHEKINLGSLSIKQNTPKITYTMLNPVITCYFRVS